MELKACSEMLTHEIQTPGNHPKERIQNPVMFTVQDQKQLLSSPTQLFIDNLQCKGMCLSCSCGHLAGTYVLKIAGSVRSGNIN
jgi:hypothetical protein